ncbi:MAG: catechol 2,3-dioxygenase-like lactoylglutathione lyase family enzyme [Planctomycetota bacterium]|jgi:catechol 2,3-dioxygenase-like lactoylglutathione lyase family enzyme
MPNQFLSVIPVLPAKDVCATIQFYVERLGFKLIFQERPEQPTYAGAALGGVELHFQGHDPDEAPGIVGQQARILVTDLDALFDECHAISALAEHQAVRDTAWGTREFGLFDPDQNGLFSSKDRH